MALPRVLTPLLLIQPRAEETGFWAAQRQHLLQVDALFAVFVVATQAPLLVTKWGAFQRTLPHVADLFMWPAACVLALAVLQVVATQTAPHWWHQHRWQVCVANRLVHGLAFLPALLRLRVAQPPFALSLLHFARDVLRSPCGTAHPLSLWTVTRLLLASANFTFFMPQPGLFPLPFVESALLQALVGLSFAALASTPTAVAAAVDPRLVERARELCVALGRPAKELSEMIFGHVPGVQEQCVRGGVPLPQRFLLIMGGVVTPLAVTWLAEYHLKTLYVTQRARQLLGQDPGPEPRRELGQDWRHQVARLLFCVRVLSVLGLMYACVWQLLAWWHDDIPA